MCPFTLDCWDYVCPKRTINLSVHEAIQEMKQKIEVPFFLEMIILVAWGA
jgi:hypothetical protein